MSAAVPPVAQPASPRRRRRREQNAAVPVGVLVLVLLPLLLMPLGAVFVFALRGGIPGFWRAVRAPEAQFALRFSLMIAFLTAGINAVLGTFAAYVLSKYRFRGDRTLGIVVNLPVAIPTVVVGTSLLLLWGPIGLLGKWLDPLGLQPMFRPAGVLLAHLFVTFPYMLGTVKPLLDELETTYEEAAYTMGNLRLRTQTAPLYIFAQFEAGDIAQANALAAVLAALSFLIFFFLFRYTARAKKAA